MRFGIGAKLGLLASVLIVGTGAVIYLAMLHWARDLLARGERAHLDTETRLGGRELLVAVESLRRTALEQAVGPALQEFLREPDDRAARDRLEARFRAALERNPALLAIEYLPPEGARPPPFQVRRRPSLRVDSSWLRGQANTDGGPLRTAWLSDVRRSADVVDDGQPVLVLCAAAPAAGTGSVVVTADFRALAAPLLGSPRRLTYLTDEKGRCLIEPDGQDEPDRPLYDRLPGLRTYYHDDLDTADARFTEGKTHAVHFGRVVYSEPGQPRRWFGLVRAIADEEIAESVPAHTGWLLWLKVGLVAGGVGLALFLSRRMTRPLHDIARATRELARGEYDVALPVKSPDEIGALARSFKDMVDQLRASGQQLRDSETRLRLVLKTAAEGIFILDEQGRIQMVNQAAERIFGYPAEELKDQNVKLLLPREVQGLPGADPGPQLTASESIKLGKVANSTRDAVGRRKDGTLFPLELSVSEAAMADGRWYTGIVRDVTQRREAEQEINDLNEHLRRLNEQLDRRVRERTAQLMKANDELALARDQAVEASRAKGEFLGQMSHELRTPINAIIGYCEMLEEESQERGLSDLLPDLQKVRQSASHLLNMVSDMLDLTAIDSHTVQLSPETFDVRDTLDAVVASMRPLLEKNGNTLEVCYGDGLGTLWADRARFRQVLANLLSNACKFTEKGTVALEAVRDRDDGRDWVVVHVRDTGIGITPEQLARLFRPFSQGDASMTRKYGGTGLGLVISRSFCEMMGGALTVQSEPGRGSTFTVRLPGGVTGDGGDPAARVSAKRG